MSNLKDRAGAATTRADVRAYVRDLVRVVRLDAAVLAEVERTFERLIETMNTSTLECAPSQETLGRWLKRDRSAISRHLAVLVRLGHLFRWSVPARRAGREVHRYGFAFGKVGRPDLERSGGVKPPAASSVRKPVRAADGTFRSAVKGVASVQGGSEAETLDGAPKAQAAARFQEAILRSGFADRWFSVADAELEAAAIAAEQNCVGGGLLVALRGLSAGG